MLFFGLGQLGWSYEFTLGQSWQLGSIISATDTVAVIAVFKKLDAEENFFAVVFGDSIFNDAIALVFYHTVKTMGAKEYHDDVNFGE